MPHSLVPFLALTFCILSAGCGSDLVRVKGKVTKNGAPLQTEQTLHLQVTLIPIDASPELSGESYAANVNRDDTFEVPGKEGKGIPKGKYRVAVELISGSQRRGKNVLQGAFSGEKSPLIYDVTGQYLEIDLGKPPQ